MMHGSVTAEESKYFDSPGFAFLARRTGLSLYFAKDGMVMLSDVAEKTTGAASTKTRSAQSVLFMAFSFQKKVRADHHFGSSPN